MIDTENDIDILLLNDTQPSVAQLVAQPVAQPQVNIIIVSNEGTVKEICNMNNIDYKKGNIYYEFIKTEKINNKKKIILMEKSTGYLFEGNNARGMLSCIDINNELTIKPGMLPNYIIFIQSTSSNRKLLKNQKIIIH